MQNLRRVYKLIFVQVLTVGYWRAFHDVCSLKKPEPILQFQCHICVQQIQIDKK